MVEEVVEKALGNALLYSGTQMLHQTPGPDDVKYFHWFEWNKKQITLYDLLSYSCTTVELDMPFNVPSFSRSIIVPHLQQIFLIGGEEPEYHPRKEIFMFDLRDWHRAQSTTSKLVRHAQMPQKKFDCTLTYMDGWIYIISGKGRSGEVVGSCHRYNPKKRSFEEMAPVRHPRYAASAVACVR